LHQEEKDLENMEFDEELDGSRETVTQSEEFT